MIIPLDGLSHLGWLLGEWTSGQAARPLFWHFPRYLGSPNGARRATPVGVICSGDWKLLEFFEDGRLELYNVKEDIGERRNHSASRPDKVEHL